MRTPTDPLSRACMDLQHLKASAKSNEEAVKHDRALAQMITAANHAKVINRFLSLSDGERQYAATMASYGRERHAEQATERADRYYAIAQRHAQAVEECRQKAEELEAS